MVSRNRAAADSAAQSDHDQGPKPTIVLVHGAFADGSSWTPVIDRLQDDGFSAIAPADPWRGPISGRLNMSPSPALVTPAIVAPRVHPIRRRQGAAPRLELRLADVLETLRQGTRGPVADIQLGASPWGFDLIKIAVSVSIFQGGRDVIHPAGIANYLDAHVPRAKLTLVPGVGSLWTLTGLRPVLQDLCCPRKNSVGARQ
jgi:pimeloyl-ACP methyl ester carboxylesterase